MTNTAPQLLYILDEDLYRLGNASSSRLGHVRQDKDVDTYERNGIVMVTANGAGISLLTAERLAVQTRGSGYVWRLPPNFPIPNGLGLMPDTRLLKPGQPVDHYFLCPVCDMPLKEYVGMLEKLALKLERLQKI